MLGYVEDSSGVYSDIAPGSAVDVFFTLDIAQAQDFYIAPDNIQYAEYGYAANVGVSLVISSVFVNGANVALSESDTSDSPFLYGVVNTGGPAYWNGGSFFDVFNAYSWDANQYLSEYYAYGTDGSLFSPSGLLPALGPGDNGLGSLYYNGSWLDYFVPGPPALPSPTAGPGAPPLDPAPVPAPLSSGLFGAGLLALLAERRRRALR